LHQPITHAAPIGRPRSPWRRSMSTRSDCCGRPASTTGRSRERLPRSRRSNRICESSPTTRLLGIFCLELFGNRSHSWGALGKNRQAAQDWAKVIDLAPEPVTPHYRITLGLKLLKIGELDRAVSQVVLARQARRGSGEDLYDLACFYSRAAASVRRDEPSRLFETYVAEGLAALRRAADGGVFRDAAMRETAQKDSDLEILRGREEFRRIVRSQ
jgi:hypothetical protein